MQIFISNLPYDVDEESLRETFSQWGAVQTARLMLDPANRSRGFAFVTMPDTDAAQQAIEELNGRDWAGRRLRVEEARPARAERLKHANLG